MLQSDLTNPKSYAPRRWFSAKTLGKSLFHFQTDWSADGPERALLIVSHIVRREPKGAVSQILSKF